MQTYDHRVIGKDWGQCRRGIFKLKGEEGSLRYELLLLGLICKPGVEFDFIYVCIRPSGEYGVRFLLGKGCSNSVQASW